MPAIQHFKDAIRHLDCNEDLIDAFKSQGEAMMKVGGTQVSFWMNNKAAGIVRHYETMLSQSRAIEYL